MSSVDCKNAWFYSQTIYRVKGWQEIKGDDTWAFRVRGQGCGGVEYEALQVLEQWRLQGSNRGLCASTQHTDAQTHTDIKVFGKD